MWKWLCVCFQTSQLSLRRHLLKPYDAHCTKNFKIFLKMANSNLISHLYTISMSAQAFISAAGNMFMCKDGIKPFKDILSSKLNGWISRNLSRICHSKIKHKKKAFRFSSKKMTAIFRTLNTFCFVIFSGVCGGAEGNTPIIVWLKDVLNKNTILSYRISSTEYKLKNGFSHIYWKMICV